MVLKCKQNKELLDHLLFICCLSILLTLSLFYEVVAAFFVYFALLWLCLRNIYDEKVNMMFNGSFRSET